MEIEEDSIEEKLEQAGDLAVELANKSLELGNTLLESFDLLATNDAPCRDVEPLKVTTNMVYDIGSPSIEARQTRRYRVVMEMVETEKRYVDGLLLLLTHFRGGLHASQLLSDHVLKMIFPPCLEHMYLLHNEIHSRLKERLVNWGKKSTISDILHLYFISKGEYLYNLYQQFLSSFSTSVSTMRMACACDKILQRRVEALEDDAVCRRLKVTSYMTTPVQRMPRYILLLKELMKVTERDTDEYASLQDSVDSVGKYLILLNQGIESSINGGGRLVDGSGMGGGGDSRIGLARVAKKSSFRMRRPMILTKKTSAETATTKKKPIRSASFQWGASKHPPSRNPRSLSHIEGGGREVFGEGGVEVGVMEDRGNMMERLLRSRTKGDDMLNVSCVSSVKKVSALKRKLSSLSDLGSSFRTKYLRPLKARVGEDSIFLEES